jgi:DnaJ-domain-containing protein 1
MTDFFALLDEPRRPWLDPDSLKARFLARSAQVHPDRLHQAAEDEKAGAARRYAELNAAYHCLREPRPRLAHLLQLERGAKPPDLQEMPADLADTFLEVAQLCRQVDTFLRQKARAGSPLLQAQLFERGQEWADKINALQTTLSRRCDALTDQLKALDTQWVNAGAAGVARGELLDRLEELYRLLSFFGRWRGQLQERRVQLAA